MRSVSSSRDVHEVRYKDEKKRIQRAKRVSEVKKKEAVTSTEYYESRGMTEENKEKKSSLTSQEIFRRELAKSQNSKIYSKLQNKQNEQERKNIEDNTRDIEEQELER